MNIGVYAIRNVVNGKRYLGSTGKLNKRWSQHKLSLNRGDHFNPYLQNAWNKYGGNCFVYEIVERCSKTLLVDQEEHWIRKLHSFKDEHGYNMCRTPRASRLGCKATPETVAKMSASLSGKNHPNWGKKMSDDWITKMKKAVTGIPKPNSGVKKKYVVNDSNGNPIEIVGLRKFCREKGISPSMLLRVICGKQKEYKGYGVVVQR